MTTSVQVTAEIWLAGIFRYPTQVAGSHDDRKIDDKTIRSLRLIVLLLKQFRCLRLRPAGAVCAEKYSYPLYSCHFASAFILGLTLGLAALPIGKLAACSVPVFRYALERWQPDNFELLVIHRGGLTDEQMTLVTILRDMSESGATLANVETKVIDSDKIPEWMKSLVEELPAESLATRSLPWMVLRSPSGFRDQVHVHSLPLTDANVHRLLDSPVRRQVANRLLEGDSVVWVFLESGDDVADRKAADTLRDELAALQETLQLPDIDPRDIEIENLSVDPDKLILRFSTVTVSRDDDRETALVRMLLTSESDLLDERFAGQPMAFPVFGRGRILYALVGQGINRDTISKACAFLTAGCQCTVKAQNPGVDLLIKEDWETKIDHSLRRDIGFPPLAGLSQFAIDDGEANVLTLQKDLAKSTTTSTQDATGHDATGHPKDSASMNPAEDATLGRNPVSSRIEKTTRFTPLKVTIGVFGLLASVVAVFSIFLKSKRA